MTDNTALTPKKMKVSELREALEARGFHPPPKMLRAQLLEKLEEMLASAVPAPAASAPVVTSSSSSLSSSGTSAPATSPSLVSTSSAKIGNTTSSAPDSSSSSSSASVLNLSNNDSESLADKKRKRAEKFQIPLVQTEADKVAARAAKFGTVEDASNKKPKISPVEEAAKLAARAAKWGTAKLPTSASDPEEQKKRAARGLKFSALSAEDQAKMAARSAKFGTPLSSTTESKTITLPATPTARPDVPTIAAKTVLSAAEQEKMDKRKAKFAIPQ